MQELRFVAVSEDGSYAVLAVPGRSGRYILPIDERLRAVAQGQTTRLAQYEIEVESPLRPKEIQARIRAGETAEEIADAAGIPVERVRWFEGPVLAERAYIADQAQAASVRRAGDSGGPGPRLGDIVPERLTASGAAPEDGQWDSRKRGDGNWQVTLTFPSGGRLHVAEWVFDARRRHVMPDDDNAARLSLPESELPSEPVAQPGEATVTPLAPRLGAAAGMGGGLSGGFSGGGSGVGVRSFRPERSVIPDRSLGGDRTLVDRPLAPPAAPVHVPAASAAPPAAYRAPAPELRAPAQPAPAGVVPVTAPPYVFDDLPAPASPASPASPTADRSGSAPSRPVVFEDPEPAFLDEQPELAAPSLPQQQSARPEDWRQQPTLAVTQEEPAASVLVAPVYQPEPTPAAPSAPAPTATAPAAPATTPNPVTPPVHAPAAAAAVATQAESARTVPAAPDTAAAQAPAQPEPAFEAAAAAAPAEPASTSVPSTESAESPLTAESPAASATVIPAPTEPSVPASAAAVASAPPEPAQPGPAQPESADDQSARQRAAAKKTAKGRRSSVPSWDEIMLGSSRQRD